MENLNRVLLQPSGTRYDSISFNVICLVSLAYWEILFSGVKLSIVVPPNHRKFLSVTELVTLLGTFLVVFSLGLGTQCVLYLLSVSPHFYVAFYSMFID